MGREERERRLQRERESKKHYIGAGWGWGGRPKLNIFFFWEVVVCPTQTHLIMIFLAVVLSTYSLEMISGQKRSIMARPNMEEEEEEEVVAEPGEEEEEETTESQKAMVAFHVWQSTKKNIFLKKWMFLWETEINFCTLKKKPTTFSYLDFTVLQFCW